MKHNALILAGCLLAPLVACEIDETELNNWKQVQNGSLKLSGYLFDAERPPALRLRAARYLFDMGELGQIMGVVRKTTESDRTSLVSQLAEFAADKLRDPGASLETQGQAATLAYHLLEFGPSKAATPLAGTLATWCLDHATERVPGVKLDHALIAATLTAPDDIVPKIGLALQNSKSVNKTLALVSLTDPLKDPKLQSHAAHALLAAARRSHPSLSVDLIDAFVRNGNETLMRYLLELARDPKVKLHTRGDSMDQAVAALGKRAIPGLLRLIGTDEPRQRNEPRNVALDHIWSVGGPESLADALNGLPVDGTYPTDGVGFKAEVDHFCDTSVSTQKDRALPVLTELLDSWNWVARLYAVNCLTRLHPGPATQLLEPLRSDATPINGWVHNDEVTLGEIVARFGTD